MYNKYHIYFYYNFTDNQYYYSFYDTLNNVCIFDKIIDFLDIFNYIIDHKIKFIEIALIFDNIDSFNHFNNLYKNLCFYSYY